MAYEIIATLGPSSRTPQVWQDMIAVGATAFRLNTSHLELEHLDGWLEKIDRYFAANACRLPVILDLQGSKWRLGDFETVELTAGQQVRLVNGKFTDQAGVLPVPHADFFQAVRNGSGELVLNDGRIRMVIESQQEDRITARVVAGGLISAHKGITFQAGENRMETLSEKDQAILAKTRSFPAVRYAVSYLKDASEMETYRTQAGGATYLIAKLERGSAMADARAIASSANEVWLCRGDLGAEVGLVEMAAAARRFAKIVPQLAVPVMMAGQVLEHMTAQPEATRSEVCYLYDTLQAGYSGFVLSDETAVGSYPVEAVRTAALFRPVPLPPFASGRGQELK